MKAKPIRTRAELLAILALKAPLASQRRAIAEDRSILLGGFTPPEELPFYLVQINSYHGQKWFAALVLDEANYRMRIRWYDEADIPWQHWNGVPGGEPSLNNGDYPIAVSYKRMKASKR